MFKPMSSNIQMIFSIKKFSCSGIINNNSGTTNKMTKIPVKIISVTVEILVVTTLYINNALIIKCQDTIDMRSEEIVIKVINCLNLIF